MYAVLVVGFLSSCREKTVLPSETQQGLNSFGVKIDGGKWVPRQKLSFLGQLMLTAEYFKEDGIFSVTARRDGNDETLTLIIADLYKPGSYVFIGGISNSSESGFRGNAIDDNYLVFAGGVNEVNITKLDTANKIVSGNFRLQLKGANKIVKNLTEGVFDVKYEN